MKFITMIMVLLLAGIGSAQNYLPESTMEPGAGIEMYSTMPGDIEMWGGDIKNATYDWPMLESQIMYRVGDMYYVRNETGHLVHSGENAEIAMETASSECGGGGRITCLPGQYNFTTGPVVINNHITIMGINNPVSTDQYLPRDCTVFNFFNTTQPGFTPYNGVTFRYIEFNYPDQNVNDTPIAYPETIRVSEASTNDIFIDHCMIRNPYYFLNATANHWTVHMDHVYGYPLKYGVVEDKCWDVSYYENVFFSERFLSGCGTGLTEWVQDNGEAFNISRSDWCQIVNCFNIGYNYGYKFDGTDSFLLANSGADGCHNPVYMVDAVGGRIQNNYLVQGRLRGDIPGTGYAIYAKTSNGNLITGNKIYSHVGGIHVFYSNTQIINNNQIRAIGVNESSSAYGILVEGGSGNQCNHNTISGTGGAYQRGMWFVGGASKFSCNDNTLSNLVDYGIVIESGCANFTCTGNILSTATILLDNSGSVTKVVENNIEC